LHSGTSAGVQVRMADLEDEFQRLREQMMNISDRLIRMEVQFTSVCENISRIQQDFKNHERRHEESRQHVPVTLIGVISATIMAVGVLAQIWISRGP
jgi:chromosome segregation ATPase